MLGLIITALILGTILGLLLVFSALWVIKVKCPECKRLKPIKEIIRFHWKTQTITGQWCQKCSTKKEQIDISL